MSQPSEGSFHAPTGQAHSEVLVMPEVMQLGELFSRVDMARFQESGQVIFSTERGDQCVDESGAQINPLAASKHLDAYLLSNSSDGWGVRDSQVEVAGRVQTVRQLLADQSGFGLEVTISGSGGMLPRPDDRLVEPDKVLITSTWLDQAAQVSA